MSDPPELKDPAFWAMAQYGQAKRHNRLNRISTIVSVISVIIAVLSLIISLLK